MKYGNKKTVIDGITFDSKLEAFRWSQLKLLQLAGEISNLERQVKFEIIPKTDKYRAVNYVADFVYTSKNGGTVVEDVKGFETKDFKLKRKLFYFVYGIDIQLIKKGDV